MQVAGTFLGIAAVLSPVLLETTDLQLLISEVRESPDLDGSKMDLILWYFQQTESFQKLQGLKHFFLIEISHCALSVVLSSG